MRVDFIDIRDFKKKFARLLSLMFHGANLSFEHISEKLIVSSYLDSFEDDGVYVFMDTSNEDIVRSLFHGVIVLDRGYQDIGPIYWAGIQYINLFLNYRIPLKVLFIMCPLKEMVNKYDIYHEMNEIELCKDFMNHEYINTSLLQHYRSRNNLSVRELSYLSKIPKPTIRYIEMNNNNLYSTSNETINVLSSIFDVPSYIFNRKSSFLPLSYNLIYSEEFNSYLKEVISEYLNKDIKSLVIEFEKPNEYKDGACYLVFESDNYIYLNKKLYHLSKGVLRQLLSLSIDRYIENNSTITLAF